MSSEDATMPSEGRRSSRLRSPPVGPIWPCDASKKGTPESRARISRKKRINLEARFPKEKFKRRKITKENITKEITEKIHKRKREREQLKKKARSANTIKGLLGCSGDGEDSCGNQFV